MIVSVQLSPGKRQAALKIFFAGLTHIFVVLKKLVDEFFILIRFIWITHACKSRNSSKNQSSKILRSIDSSIYLHFWRNHAPECFLRPAGLVIN